MHTHETKKCLPCEGQAALLTSEEITQNLGEIPGWELSSDQKWISRRYTFKNFYKSMAFVNAVAWIAHDTNHHPDLELGYNYCLVKYSTHALDGLSMNDFICAQAVSRLTNI